MNHALRLQIQDDETGTDAPSSSWSYYNCTNTHAEAEIGG